MGAGFYVFCRPVVPSSCVVAPGNFALWPPRIPALLRRAPRAYFEPKTCSISVTVNE